MICKKCYATPAFLFSGMLMLLVGALPASGQNSLCTQDAYNSYNGLTGTHAKTLSCTANDVSVSKVTGVAVINPDGTVTPGGKCISGTSFSFIANFTIQTTSNATRSNIGIFFGTGASNLTNDQALTGTCSDSILTPTYSPAGKSYVLGDPTYEELDTNGETSPTACGDTSSTDGNGTGQQQAELEVDNVSCPLTALDPCPDPTISGTCMALPECTSWWQPTANIPLCNSPTHAWVNVAVPGTTSKCNCTTLYIPIQLVQPSATVAKTCTTGTANAAKTNCDLGAEGGNETYQVTITNTTPANEGGIIIDQICDNRYGTIYDDGVPANRCPAGTISNAPDGGTSCNASTPGDIPNGGSGSCTFTVSHGENLSVTDQVTVAGHSDLTASQTFNPPASNTVTVTSSDAPTTAKTDLGLAPGPVNACVTLRYNVTVTNTSAADEDVTLNQVGTLGAPGYTPALLDSYFGDITTTNGDSHTAGSVTGTTCGVDTAASGLGTLSASSGAGKFPQVLAHGSGTPPTGNGGSYTCQFDGVICGTPGPIPPATGATCSEGLQVQNTTVTPNLTGDDPAPNADTITVTANPFSAVVCLNQSGS
jgi:hypothetical protein